jgi:hypothetical protein
MGNSQPRYFNDKEALEIIGKHTAERLASQLNQNGRYLDYNLFCQIIAVQFDRMVPSPLLTSPPFILTSFTYLSTLLLFLHSNHISSLSFAALHSQKPYANVYSTPFRQTYMEKLK